MNKTWIVKGTRSIMITILYETGHKKSLKFNQA